jgi:ribosomal protein S18 acetylase RimI-like enzyme
MTIVIRDAEDGDLAALSRFLMDVWHHTYDKIMGRDKVIEISSRWHTMDRLAGEIGRPGTVSLLAMNADNIIGHAFASEGEPGVLKLERLYIGTGNQRQGVGKQLLDCALRRFPGNRKIRLEVDRENDGAIRFYQANGFAIVGQTDDCGGDSDRSALIMERNETAEFRATGGRNPT